MTIFRPCSKQQVIVVEARLPVFDMSLNLTICDSASFEIVEFTAGIALFRFSGTSGRKEKDFAVVYTNIRTSDLGENDRLKASISTYFHANHMRLFRSSVQHELTLREIEIDH